MNEIYVKIYVENENILVLEGQSNEDKEDYYPTRWSEEEKRIGTVVGLNHISISEEGKKLLKKLLKNAKHSHDDFGDIDIFMSYGKDKDGVRNEKEGLKDIFFSYIGNTVSKINVDKAIDDDFFICINENLINLEFLNKITVLEK